MNHMTRQSITMATFLTTMMSFTGCERSSNDAPMDGGSVHESTSTASNRVAIPAPVRSNLGITFAQVERRRIADTLRAPGRFEYLPNASREYRTMLPGRVDILVDQFEEVMPGTPLFRIDSPQWRDLQQPIAQAAYAVTQSQTTLDSYGPLIQAHERHEESLKESIEIWSARVKKLDALREAGGGRMSEFIAARSAMASAQADLAEVQERDAELQAARIQTEAALGSAEAQFELAMDTAASLVGIDRATLAGPSSSDPDALPTWRSISAIEVRALAPGIVKSIDLANGAWADERANVVTVVQPEQLRFHASGLQSDLGVLRDGLKVSIVPPTPTAAGNAVPLHDTMHGTLALGLSGDADGRTIDLYVTPDQLASWARPGVTAQLEIVTDATTSPELAIPLAAVQRDGLTPVIFRRAPDNPNEAIRMDADLGVDDGRWVAVLSGLRDGDEIILDGGFQLMLATSGSIQKGGHFHADGTFHEGEH